MSVHAETRPSSSPVQMLPLPWASCSSVPLSWPVNTSGSSARQPASSRSGNPGQRLTDSSISVLQPYLGTEGPNASVCRLSGSPCQHSAAHLNRAQASVQDWFLVTLGPSYFSHNDTGMLPGWLVEGAVGRSTVPSFFSHSPEQHQHKENCHVQYHRC